MKVQRYNSLVLFSVLFWFFFTPTGFFFTDVDIGKLVLYSCFCMYTF